MTETVKESFSTLFSNRTVLVLAVIGGVLATILYFLFSGIVSATVSLFLPASPTPSMSTGLASSGFGLGGVVAAIVLSLVIAFVSASVISAVAMKSDIGGAVRNGSSRYLWFLITDMIVVGILSVSTILAVVPAVLVPVGSLLLGSFAAVLVALSIIGFILTILFSVRLFIAPVEAVVGGKGPIESIKSSWNATKGSFFSILGVLFAMGIAVWVISGIATAVFSAVGVPAIGTLIGMVFGSSFTVAAVLIYNALGGMAPAMAKK